MEVTGMSVRPGDQEIMKFSSCLSTAGGPILEMDFTMLTRREILGQLRAAGVTEWSLLKRYCRDFEHYMSVRHGLGILPRGKGAETLPRIG
jgi:hypothetical protein